MSISKENLIVLHDRAQAMKEHIWTEHKTRDLPPHMELKFRDSGWVDGNIEVLAESNATLMEYFRRNAPEELAALITDMDYGSTVDLVRLALQFIMGGVTGIPEGDVLEAVTLHAEGAMAECHVSDPDYKKLGEDLQRGDLLKDLATNPASTVVEVLSTYYFEDDLVGGCEFSILHHKWHLGEGGQLAWDGEPVIMGPDDAEMSGAMLDAVAPFIIAKEVTKKGIE